MPEIEAAAPDLAGEAARASRRAAATLPPDVATVARHCMLDWLGVALRGAREPVTLRTADAVAAWSAGGGGATLIGRRERAGALNAALLNGVAGHALDYDDTNADGFHGHATAPILPAALALAELHDAPLRALVEALVAGVAAGTVIGRRMNPAHYDAGWHATATVGTFGAAAACAHLLELGEDGRRRALGLAGLQAAGLKAGFGSMGKPLQVGKAAANGLAGALLAAQGIEAPDDVLEAVPALYGGTPGSWPGTPPERAIMATLFKQHASCHGTHAAIELLARLRAEHAIEPTAVRAVELTVAPALLGVCDVGGATTGLEAKFSLRMTAALALRGADTADPGTFTDARVADPELRALAALVTVEADPAMTDWQAHGTVRLDDGRTLAARADIGRPADDLALQATRLLRKFELLAVPALGADCARAVATLATTLDPDATVRGLTAALRAPA